MKTNSNTYHNKINQEDKHKNYSIKVYEEKEAHSPYLFLFLSYELVRSMPMKCNAIVWRTLIVGYLSGPWQC